MRLEIKLGLYRPVSQ